MRSMSRWASRLAADSCAPLAPSDSSSLSRSSSSASRFLISSSRSASISFFSSSSSFSISGRSLWRRSSSTRVIDVRGEVDDPLEVLRRQVQQVAQAAGDALEVPDVRDRSGQLDVAHAVAADLAARDLHAAALADDALEPDPLVLAAVALPVPRGTEDALAEQAVLLRLQGPVVDGLRLLDLAVGPRPDLIRGGQADPELIEVVDVQHVSCSPPQRGSLFVTLQRCRVPARRLSRSPPPPARAGRGRCPAPRRPGTRPRRSRAARSPCPRTSGPPRSGTGTASP